jgi:hypothetical protein
MADVIQPIADALADIARAAGMHVPDDTWTVGTLKPPCAEIEVPNGNRNDPEQSESQLGSDDWNLEFPVTLWVDLHRATEAQIRLKDLLEAFIVAVDSDRSLGLAPATVGFTLDDASVVSFERVYQLERDRQLVGYETTVAVLALVPSS